MSASAHVFKADQGIVWVLEQNHFSNNRANQIGKTQLLGTPSYFEIPFVKALFENELFLCRTETSEN